MSVCNECREPVTYPPAWHEENRLRAHWVYRCYDADRRLVYVGCTLNLPGRLEAHRVRSWWADQVVKVKATVHPNRAEGNRVERVAIRTEFPRWNTGKRWPAGKDWTEATFKDFVYAILRYGNADVGIENVRVQAALAEFQSRFGRPLSDQRITDFLALKQTRPGAAA